MTIIPFQTKYLPDWGIYLMIAFSGWLVLSHLLMTGYACVKDGEVKAGFQDDPVVKTGLNVFVVVGPLPKLCLGFPPSKC